MILVYPMIVSSSVSNIALPIICKALEKYIIIYRYDDIISKANKRVGTPRRTAKDGPGFKIKNGKIVREAAASPNIPVGQGSKSHSQPQPQPQPQPQSSIADKKDDKKSTIGSDVKANMPELKTLQLEPTWITVQINTTDSEGREVKRTEFIGIKVVPTVVQSDDNLANMLLYDKQSNFIHTLAIKIGRAIIKKMYNVWDGALAALTLGWIKSGKSNTVTGNARKDVVHNRTDFDTGDARDRSRIFVCLSAIEITDDFFVSTAGINKLFKMGWNNIIIADDVNRLVHFCTMEYKGQCAPMSFAALYNSFDAGKVYGTLDEIAKSAGSLFKRRFSAAKIQANMLASHKLNRYRGR